MMNSKVINMATIAAGTCSLFALTGCQNDSSCVKNGDTELRTKSNGKDEKALRGGKNGKKNGNKNKEDKKNKNDNEDKKNKNDKEDKKNKNDKEDKKNKNDKEEKENKNKENEDPQEPVDPADPAADPADPSSKGADQPPEESTPTKTDDKSADAASKGADQAPEKTPEPAPEEPVSKATGRKLELVEKKEDGVSFVELNYNDSTSFADWLKLLQDENSGARQDTIDAVKNAAKKLGSETIKIECIPVDSESADKRPFAARILNIEGLKKWQPTKFDTGNGGIARKQAGPNDLAVAFDIPSGSDRLVIPHKPEGKEVENYENFNHLFKFFNDASLKEYQYAVLKKVAEECSSQLEEGKPVHLQTHGCSVGFLHFRTRTERKHDAIKNYETNWKFAADHGDVVVEAPKTRKSKRAQSGRIAAAAA